MFQLIAQASKARRGRLTTAHGVIDTPAFMPVGTQGSVKAVSPRELQELDAQIVLGNSYHLFVRPGIEVIKHFGGLHKFMSWDGPILTDSGGFQVFSLQALRELDDEGVTFASHLDGSRVRFTPENVIAFQEAIGVDVAMVLD
ncbi:MAG: tRNA-guanine transglycosylase, partial [Chthoniobacterales bacterium]